jgi:hypothetical protein
MQTSPADDLGDGYFGGMDSFFVFLGIFQSANTFMIFVFVFFLLMFVLYFFLFISQLAVLFGPRVVLTLDSAGVAIDGNVLTIGWEEIGSIERVYQSRRANIGDTGWRGYCSRKRITYLDKLTIVPLDERCAARWKESWHLRSRPLGCLLRWVASGVSASGVVLTRFNFPTSIEQLDESLRELYGVFHGGELRVNDTWLVREEGCVEPFEHPTSSTLPAAAADPPAIAIPAIVLKSFAKSRYKALYSSTSLGDINSGTVLQDMQSMIFLFAAQRSIPRAEAQAFVDRVLQHIRGDSDGLIVDEIAQQQDTIKSAVRLWACAEQLTVGEAQAQAYQGLEVCSILNEAIREDAEPILEPAIRLARAITFFCCSPKYDSKQWPDGENSTTPDTTYRGGGLPRRHIPWFSEPGKTFRSRQFISSSFQWSVAKLFMDRRQAAVQAVQHLEREDPILWVFKFQRDCLHVNFIDPSASGFEGLEGELEFLLVPYTVLTVEEAKWQETPTSTSPHAIILRVASDNRAWPEDLPTAPWA